MNILSADQFISILDEGIQEDLNSNIEFNDEIVSIESVGMQRTYDINVSGEDHFFYANDILTHNSATGNVDFNDVDNSSVSDSIGTVQTADFILFLLQNPQMKEEGLMTCKVTKNRFNGRTDYWDMNIDYEHMRFKDAIVDGEGMNDMEVKTEIATIMMEDIEKVKKHDNAIKEDFDINDLLGL